MKRDLDLFRSILSSIEESEEFYVDTIDIEVYDEDIISNHLVLLKEEDLIEGDMHFASDGKLYGFELRLTNKGYEYIALAKNDTIWNKLKSRLKEKAIDFSFDVSKYMLTDYAKELLK